MPIWTFATSISHVQLSVQNSSQLTKLWWRLMPTQHMLSVLWQTVQTGIKINFIRHGVEDSYVKLTFNCYIWIFRQLSHGIDNLPLRCQIMELCQICLMFSTSKKNWYFCFLVLFDPQSVARCVCWLVGFMHDFQLCLQIYTAPITDMTGKNICTTLCAVVRSCRNSDLFKKNFYNLNLPIIWCMNMFHTTF